MMLEKFCTCLELWKGCIMAGIFAMSTSIFDLLWSISHMIEEDNVIFFYLLFALGIESIIFMAATGMLFVGLIKKSRCLLIPWLIVALIDIIFSLVIAFAELALPNDVSSAACSLPLISMVVTFLVCLILLYCWLCVYAQYLAYSNNSGVTEIKVTPEKASHPIANDVQAPPIITRTLDSGPISNTLSVPQVSTPKDAW